MKKIEEIKISELKLKETEVKEIIEMMAEKEPEIKRISKLEPYYSKLPFENIISFYLS